MDKPKPEALYFERHEHDLPAEQLINALDGVCHSLYQWDGSTNDDDEVNRVANLAVAAAILTRQLQSRQTSKPVSKRLREEGRRVRAEWLAARERLAGPAEGQA